MPREFCRHFLNMKYGVILFVLATTITFAEVIRVQKISPYDEKILVETNPSIQNIPLDAGWEHVRPPAPRIEDDNTATIFIGLSAFRDGERCGKTIFTAFKRAKFPMRVHFGVVDQRSDDEIPCLKAYCAFAKSEWPQEECRYKDQIKIDYHEANTSRGPTFARSLQQKLIEDEEFCLQLDAHSIFTNGWDQHLIEDWKSTGNEMAVLSTYLHDLHNYISENGDNNPPSQLPHLCKTKRGGNGLVRNEGASMIHHPMKPQMSALWGAGLSFSKCHAEKRVLIDPHTLWMFDGEEFLRSSHLWTFGYDIYSPSVHGAVVYHNYTSVPKRFEYLKVDANTKKKEKEMGANRFRLLVGMEFKGLVDAEELQKYNFGKVRTFDQYLNFSGVTFTPGVNDTSSCRQLHWVPYSDPTPIENLLSGWKMDRKKDSKVVVSQRIEKDISDEAIIEKDSDEPNVVKIAPVNEDARSASQLRHFDSNATPSQFPLLFIAVIVFLFVMVYSNDRIWVFSRRLFRAKSNQKK